MLAHNDDPPYMINVRVVHRSGPPDHIPSCHQLEFMRCPPSFIVEFSHLFVRIAQRYGTRAVSIDTEDRTALRDFPDKYLRLVWNSLIEDFKLKAFFADTGNLEFEDFVPF